MSTQLCKHNSAGDTPHPIVVVNWSNSTASYT